MKQYFHGLVGIISKGKSKRCKDVQEIDSERTRIINEANEKFNDELNKKLQVAEMQKQIIEEKAKESEIDDIQVLHYVQRMIKAFDPNQDDNEILKCLEKVVKNAKKVNQELNQEDALAQTLSLLRQPKKHPRKGKNNNPQQVDKQI